VTIALHESGWRRALGDWRLQLGLILVSAIVLRALFFVGFGLGDDLGYIGHADSILAGHYPPLDPLNQYAYRPLLLYLFAGGIALFGHTDLGVVAPVFLAGVATSGIVFLFVRTLVDPAAAWWCALLFAFEPFNVVNSTTMTNDVILACLTFAGMTLFLIADRCQSGARSRWSFAGAGLLMIAAFLIKIAFLPILFAVGLYSLAALRGRPRTVLTQHAIFYGTVLAGLVCVCVVYYVKKGDLFWQFKAETFYYQTYKPDWYQAGLIDYAALMWQYPRSLFGLSGYYDFRYFDHGLLFWLVAPAACLVIVRGRSVLRFLVAVCAIVFLFFEFYPQYLTPRYLPLVRQDRYLELMLPAAAIIAGTALHALFRRHRALATCILAVLLVDSVVEASRRYTEYDDSQRDMRELARYAEATIAPAGGCLAVDLPARNALSFYLRSTAVQLQQIAGRAVDDVRNCYIAVGGARSFWWSGDQVFDIMAQAPPHWIRTYTLPGPIRPWRRSSLRVFFVHDPPVDWYALFDAPQQLSRPPTRAGLTEIAFADGFDGPVSGRAIGQPIPDLDNRTPLPTSHVEWNGWMRTENAMYTFEANSDDGSWIELNGKSVLDNGGTHPARLMRRSVRLASGWYRFRMRYEDTGGDRFLALRIFKDHLAQPVPQSTLFYSFEDGDGSNDSPLQWP
jgi:4-amino-4-deoxy-L-arabinose transferase-like glycosyltransferase